MRRVFSVLLFIIILANMLVIVGYAELSGYNFSHVYAIADLSSFSDESDIYNIDKSFCRPKYDPSIIKSVHKTLGVTSDRYVAVDFLVQEPVNRNAIKLLEFLNSDSRFIKAEIHEYSLFDYIVDPSKVYDTLTIGPRTIVSEYEKETGGDIFYYNGIIEEDSFITTQMLYKDKNGVFKKIIVSGDVNCDGMVTSQDARTILRLAAHLTTLKGDIYTAADMNNSGGVSAKDAREALRQAAYLGYLLAP